MNVTRLSATIGCAILAGCAVMPVVNVQLTPGGEKVRTITPTAAQNCIPVGFISSYVHGWLRDGENDMRNKVAAAGGNAMVVISRRLDPPPDPHAELAATAYRCDSKQGE